MGCLALVNGEGEWCNPPEAFALLLPIEREARDIVLALLESLPDIYG
jgi:hypothetical protein